MSAAAPASRGFLNTALRIIERGGNALPQPASLFLIFALVVMVVSAIAARMGIEVLHPATGKTIAPMSLLTVEGLHRIVTNMVSNFTGFAPLGTVLVALLGIGVAESSGLIGACMRLVVLSAPRRLLTAVLVFCGVMSNMASEIGYVLLVPLAAMIFQAAGRHPIAGLAAAFAGVSAGYSANLLLGTIDPLLAGLTQEAARIIQPDAKVNAACNYYFMFASTFLLTGVGTWVTEKIVVPRLGSWKGDAAEAARSIEPLSKHERRGLWAASAVGVLFLVFLAAGTLPDRGYLRDPKDGALLHSPFMSGIVSFIFLGGVLCGLAYGIAARTIRNDGDALKGMSKSMETLGGYLVLVFFASQFVAYFNWTNLGLILAVKGAALLKASGFGGIPLMLCLVLLTACVNLFMGSASAKWALMAPVFVPMFMLLGQTETESGVVYDYPPELVQVAYRVGDSCTNIISPGMSYFALIIAFFQRYDKQAGIGTLVATMLPYSIIFLITWSLFLTAWIALGIPFGF
jgi:aminobenzoyl-glutamate transport protein